MRLASNRYPWRASLAMALALLLIGSPAVAHQSGHLNDAGVTTYFRSVGHYRVPRVTLLDQTGALVPLVAELSGSGPIILQFIFTTCPTVCPILTHSMSAAQDSNGQGMDGARLVSITIDPEHDTPKRLASYAKEVGAAKGWRFLTGEQAKIVEVLKAFDADFGNKMRHVALTFLKADARARWIRFEGFITPDELLAEYRRLGQAR
jgi:protein SCO1